MQNLAIRDRAWDQLQLQLHDGASSGVYAVLQLRLYASLEIVNDQFTDQCHWCAYDEFRTW